VTKNTEAITADKLPADIYLIPTEEIRDRVADAVTKARTWRKGARVTVVFAVGYDAKEERVSLSTQVKSKMPTKENVDTITTGEREEVATWKEEIPGQTKVDFNPEPV
jgi:hypothetical protein